MTWRSESTAPKTGEHILVTSLDNHSFGFCGGKWQDWCAVVHWWDGSGEEGFYLSSGLSGIDNGEDRPIAFSHWRPLSEESLAASVEEGSKTPERASESPTAASKMPQCDDDRHYWHVVNPRVGEPCACGQMGYPAAPREASTDYEREVQRVSELLVAFDGNTEHTTVSDHLAALLERFRSSAAPCVSGSPTPEPPSVALSGERPNG